MASTSSMKRMQAFFVLVQQSAGQNGQLKAGVVHEGAFMFRHPYRDFCIVDTARHNDGRLSKLLHAKSWQAGRARAPCVLLHRRSAGQARSQ